MYKKNIDPEVIKAGMKEDKRLYIRFIDRINEIEINMGANINYNKDFTDNHRYNKLRTKLIAKRKRQEDREDSERI